MTYTHKHQVWQRNPDGKKRALVIRLGAIGDAIICSSIFPLLKEQGYHVTVNCKPGTHDILRHDPHVDEWFIQETDFVPNQELGAQWASLSERYDKIINLCESVEGALLQMPGRLTHSYPDDVRRTLYGDVSYLGRTHDIAGVARVYNPRFYATEQETKWAKALKKAWTRNEVPLITWAIAGSAAHKIYPWVAVVIKWLLEKTSFHIALTGDKGVGDTLQNAILEADKYEGFDMTRVHGMAGKWTIRETLALAQQSDVVIGPETGVLNAVSFEPAVAKVLYLSHSSAANIGNDWINTTVLEPEAELCPCFPCHRLHSNWEFCHQSEKTHAALCASSIRPETVFAAIMTSLGAVKLAA